MALEDILTAITAEADRQIAEARTRHQKELSDIRQQSADAVERKRRDIAEQKETKLRQMRHKAEVHAETSAKNAVLEKKRELLNGLFAQIAEALGKLEKDKAEKLLRALLKKITIKGELHPTKAHADLLKRLAPSEQFTVGKTVDGSGGFLFVAPKREYDFRFETLVADVIRPMTELSVAEKLFPSTRA